MNSFCGIFFKNGIQAGLNEVETMLSAFRNSSPAGAIREACFAAGVARYNLKVNQEEIPLLYENDDYIAVFSGRIDYFPEEEVSPDSKIRLSYERLFNLLQTNPASIRGDYVAALFVKESKTLILFRDPLGTRPFYYAETSSFLAFSTEINALRTLQGCSFPMDEQWIADTISTVKSENWRTPYSGIKRIIPGHYLRLQRDSEVKRYWDLSYKSISEDINYTDAVEEFRKRLITAIKRRLSDRPGIASELSGGLDSSGITALAYEITRAKGFPFFAFTHGFNREIPVPYFPYIDEREYSHEVIRHLGIDNFITCDAGEMSLIEKLKLGFEIQSGPVQQVFSLVSDGLYSRAKDLGVNQLLSGFGGDEGVTSKAAGYFEELISEGDWQTFKKEYFLYCERKNISRITTNSKYFFKRFLPGITAYLAHTSGRQGMELEKVRSLGFNSDFAKRFNIIDRYFERKVLSKDGNVRERQYSRIMHDHVSQRLEYSWLDARYYGIEYVYPLLDLDLLEYYFSLPSKFKFRNGYDRAIFRDSMINLIPEKVRLKDSATGMAVPTFHKRILDDLNDIRNLIVESKKYNRYHYLDYDAMLEWAERIMNRSFKDKVQPNTTAFTISIQILLLQEMEREGSFRSGIRV